MKNLSISHFVNELRGFLGLTGYKKFIRGFGFSNKPLIELLKKNNFSWNEKAQSTFDKIKKALCEAPILALLNFNNVFVLETDACATGLRAILITILNMINSSLKIDHESLKYLLEQKIHAKEMSNQIVRAEVCYTT